MMPMIIHVMIIEHMSSAHSNFITDSSSITRYGRSMRLRRFLARGCTSSLCLNAVIAVVS